MANEPLIVKWYVVFDILAKALAEHYNKCTIEKRDSGSELFKILLSGVKFKHHHTWIRKFSSEFGVDSIDPIHVFASFNGASIPYQNRTIRLKAIFDALAIETNFDEIDFEGCPAPTITRILSVRKKDVQNQIWIFFIESTLWEIKH